MVAFCNLLKKTSFIFDKVYDLHSSHNFKIKEIEHDHGLLCIKDATLYGVNSNATGEQFVKKDVTLYNSVFFSNLQNSQMYKHT
jgi:hypothetical protein